MGSYRLNNDLRAALELNPCAAMKFEYTGPIFRLFQRQAALTPAAVALQSAQGTWTYSQLNELSNCLAGRLKESGIGRGDVVALYADRNPAVVCAMLGVLKCGAAFFVADSAYPAARTLACFELAKPSFMVICGEVAVPRPVASKMNRRFTHSTFRLPATVEQANVALAEFSPLDCPIDIKVNDTAYLNFTSGSTGTPKCIATSHAPLPHFIEWHVRTHGLSKSDRFSMLSGLGHDPVLRDIFTPLSIGASLHIPEQATIFDPVRLSAWLAGQWISVIHLTPALGQIIAAGEQDGSTLRSIRHLFWGGDVLNSKLSQRMHVIAPNARHVIFYGATETPQAMSSQVIDASAEREGAPIGKAIDDVQILIVVDGKRLAQVGEVGEILIRTPYLSQGYLFDDEQTKARYVANPFTNDPADRCYKTGDLGKVLPNGNVAFAGRSDHQVKIRGFRVELDEVTSHVERQPGIARALVFARDMGRDSKVLVAYYTCETNQDIRSDKLAEAIRTNLPCYMVPSHFVRLERFPLLPNGKIDLLALPSPKETSDRAPDESDLPTTPREMELAKVWCEILKVEQVGVNSSFLDMGGDSLSAISALLSMERLGVPEELARGVIQGKTIAQIVREEQGGAGAIAAPEPLSGGAKASKLVNVLRGILVTIVVADHWLPGLLKRLPERFAGLQDMLAVLFNIATPGFAFVFGVSLGFNYFPKFKQNREQVTRQLRFGLLLVGIAVALSSVLDIAATAARGKELTYTSICVTPYSSLLYYLLALATAPLWFRVIARFRNPAAAALGLMVAFYVAHRASVMLLLEHEQTGPLQLIRLMLVAKFDYFNMSVGALAGMALGIQLSSRRSIDGLSGEFITKGVLLVLSGLGLLYFEQRNFADLSDGANMHVWRWLFFVGALLVLASMVSATVNRCHQLPRLLRISLNYIAALGQCSLLVFVFHKVVLQIKALLGATGLPDWAALLIPLVAFAVICGGLIRKVYRLYYSDESKVQGGNCSASAELKPA